MPISLANSTSISITCRFSFITTVTSTYRSSNNISDDLTIHYSIMFTFSTTVNSTLKAAFTITFAGAVNQANTLSISPTFDHPDEAAEPCANRQTFN